jgi:hypothetical protein
MNNKIKETLIKIVCVPVKCHGVQHTNAFNKFDTKTCYYCSSMVCEDPALLLLRAITKNREYHIMKSSKLLTLHFIPPLWSSGQSP